MELTAVLQQAINSATRAASIARLPSGLGDVAKGLMQARNATSLAGMAAGMLTAGSPLLGAQAGLARRAAGILTLASKDLAAAGNEALKLAGVALGAATSKLKKAMGGALSVLAGGGVAGQLLRASGLASMFGDGGGAGGQGFLLELAPTKGAPFRFELGKAAYDSFARDTGFNIADQERLTRLPAQQAVAKGKDTISLRGAIYLARHGAGHIDRLRELGAALEPLTVTTGYGDYLGRWYLSRLQEEQGYLFADGAPRKQGFTLELVRYGDDYQNV
ncbi:phage tail protein [Chromobacterium haemolyticum]|uniref:Phage tail protein n=1 Tax=Chromobacterium haemolyticum TaxID=394935 RepID=A0A1W0CDP0_9NEIS|nr:phage tail protein [Chromobacterium haemolyticum]OQS32837.1 hypothetical protein B0T45_21280 [Chromobacterium haemolyticum]